MLLEVALEIYDSIFLQEASDDKVEVGDGDDKGNDDPGQEPLTHGLDTVEEEGCKVTESKPRGR